jgi:hypothetical protein
MLRIPIWLRRHVQYQLRKNEMSTKTIEVMSIEEVLRHAGQAMPFANAGESRLFFLSVAHYMKDARRWRYARDHEVDRSGHLTPDEYQRWIDEAIERSDGSAATRDGLGVDQWEESERQRMRMPSLEGKFGGLEKGDPMPEWVKARWKLGDSIRWERNGIGPDRWFINGVEIKE